MTKFCDWAQKDWDDCDWGRWQTSCGEYFYMTDSSPSENQMKFCCYCGKPIRENLFKREEEVNDEEV